MTIHPEFASLDTQGLAKMPHSPYRSVHRISLRGALALLVCTSAAAQTDGRVSLERQTDDAFRQVLQQPEDLSRWSKYAQLLVEAGNYEGGIAALERLLLDPNAGPELRVEIAALYFRLGSFAMAEALLREALADSRLQGEKRQLATSMLRDVTRRNQRNQFNGSVFFGVGYQSNPMYRTDDDQIFVNGVLVPVPSNQKPESDTDFNLGMRVQHFYDLYTQNSAAFSSSFSAQWVNYSSASGSQLEANPTDPYDLLVLDLNVGLQFKPAPVSASTLLLRPNVIVSNVTAQQHQYLSSVGLGLDTTWRPNERTLFELLVDGQQRNFSERVDVPDANNLDGAWYGALARVSRELFPGHVLTAQYAWRANRTDRDFYDFDSHEVRVSYSLFYRGLFGGGYWTTTLWGGALNRDYDAADPSVDPNQVREDREWRVGISQSVRLSPVWSLLLGADYATNDGNLPNFRYENTSVSAAVARTF